MADGLNQTAQSLRKTSGYAKAANTLFSDKVLSLNPTAIVGILGNLGIKIPPEVRITADVAQIVVAGGAMVSDAQKAASWSQWCVPGAQVLQATTDILETTGLMKSSSPAAEVLTLGTDIALVISGGGLNVLADLKFILDVINLSQIGQGVADAAAQSNLNDMLKARATLQTDALSQNFAAFHNGQINIFDLIGKVAEQSPDYFTTYFPSLKQFFPTGPVEIYASSSYTDMFGAHTSHAETYVNTLINNDHFTVINTIWDALVFPSIRDFIYYDNWAKNLNQIRALALGLLTTLPPYIKCWNSNLNVSGLLNSFDLTPNDLMDTIFDNYFFQKLNIPKSTGVTFNGVDYINPQNTSTSFQNSALYQKLVTADLDGDIGTLLENLDGQNALNSWGSPKWPTTDGTALGSINYRNYQNFFAALSLISEIKNDPYFTGNGNAKIKNVGGTAVISTQLIEFQNKIQNQTQGLPSSDAFSSMAQDLNLKCHARKMNRLALQNIAFGFNTTPDKLVISPPVSGQPVVVNTGPINIKPLAPTPPAPKAQPFNFGGILESIWDSIFRPSSVMPAQK